MTARTTIATTITRKFRRDWLDDDGLFQLKEWIVVRRPRRAAVTRGGGRGLKEFAPPGLFRQDLAPHL